MNRMNAVHQSTSDHLNGWAQQANSIASASRQQWAVGITRRCRAAAVCQRDELPPPLISEWFRERRCDGAQVPWIDVGSVLGLASNSSRSITSTYE